MGVWGFEVLEFWSFGVLEFWSLEFWSFGVLGFWIFWFGELGFLSFRGFLFDFSAGAPVHLYVVPATNLLPCCRRAKQLDSPKQD